MGAEHALRPTGRIRAWLAALALALAATGLLAAPAGAIPGKFWGVVPQANPSGDELQRLRAGGVDSIRVSFGWGSIQPVRGGAFDWSSSDLLVGRAANAGIEVLPFVNGAPTWAVRVDRRYASPVTLPVRTGLQKSGWRNFLRSAVLRYGPNGSFWAENPGVPKRPIRTWQIWNEPNFMYFVRRPNPGEYGRLVKLSYSALRSVDGGARLVLGGLFSRPAQADWKRRPPLAYHAADFLDRMYRQTPGIKSKFHGIALHPYTGTYRRYIPYIEEVRRVLRLHRDGGKGLWLTEVGWSSGPPKSNNSFAKGRRGQATQLKGAFRLIRTKQRRWHVQRVYWFSVDDQAGSCNFCDGSGLFSTGFVPKPAWFAYVAFAGGRAG